MKKRATKKKPKTRPRKPGEPRFEIRLRPEEKARIEEAAARTIGSDGRPLTVSAWTRTVLLKAADEPSRGTGCSLFDGTPKPGSCYRSAQTGAVQHVPGCPLHEAPAP